MNTKPGFRSPGADFRMALVVAHRIMRRFGNGGGQRLGFVAFGLFAMVAVSVGGEPSPTNFASVSATQVPLFKVRSVTVNNRVLPASADGAVNLPPHPESVVFTYGPDPQAANVPLRFRCQLDGYEQEWHERSAWMRMMIRFIDANDRLIAEQAFEVRGESPGWTGNFTNSPWVRRHEVVTVPADSDHLWVVISSAGPPEAVGAFAVRNLTVFTAESDTNGIRLIAPVRRDASKAADEATKISPAGWGRAGLRPANARLLRYGSGEEVALAILDDYPQGHVDWNTAKERGPKLIPGQKLTLTWEEVYSIGVADFGRADYTKLPAGLYRFRMEALDLMGVPTGRGSSSLVLVPVAAWRTFWFWVAIGAALVVVVGGIWRLVSAQKMKRHVQELERLRALEQERLRIAQNIHDDLGARVTEIALLSSTAQFKPDLSATEARAQFGILSRLTSELVRAMYETVWAVNPKNDDLDSLASFVCQLAEQMCAQAQLRCRLEMPELRANIPLASAVRHNVIMAVKEAIHNVIKHGHATEIQIRMAEVKDVFTIEVSDDGCGFDPAVTAHGNGLDNMERRLRSLQGSCAVASRPGSGTKVTLAFPLPVM